MLKEQACCRYVTGEYGVERNVCGLLWVSQKQFEEVAGEPYDPPKGGKGGKAKAPVKPVAAKEEEDGVMSSGECG